MAFSSRFFDRKKMIWSVKFGWQDISCNMCHLLRMYFGRHGFHHKSLLIWRSPCQYYISGKTNFSQVHWKCVSSVISSNLRWSLFMHSCKCSVRAAPAFCDGLCFSGVFPPRSLLPSARPILCGVCFSVSKSISYLSKKKKGSFRFFHKKVWQNPVEISGHPDI